MFDPATRINARAALEHKFLKDLSDPADEVPMKLLTKLFTSQPVCATFSFPSLETMNLAELRSKQSSFWHKLTVFQNLCGKWRTRVPSLEKKNGELPCLTKPKCTKLLLSIDKRIRWICLCISHYPEIKLYDCWYLVFALVHTCPSYVSRILSVFDLGSIAGYTKIRLVYYIGVVGTVRHWRQWSRKK